MSAAPLDILSSEFIVTVRDVDGTGVSVAGDTVPYLPDRACYRWRIRLDAPPPLVRYTEVFTLPEAPEIWGGEDNAFGTSRVSPDRVTSTTTEFAAPLDGWIEHGWCVAPDDPLGEYMMAVTVEGGGTTAFRFTVGPAAGFGKIP